MYLSCALAAARDVLALDVARARGEKPIFTVMPDVDGSAAAVLDAAVSVLARADAGAAPGVSVLARARDVKMARGGARDVLDAASAAPAPGVSAAVLARARDVLARARALLDG